jgi:hypothetical protein
VSGAKAALEAVKNGQQKLAENVAEFLLDEKQVLVRPPTVDAFGRRLAPARRRRARCQAPGQTGTETGIAIMLKFLRLLKILRVSVRYGLDEIAISGLKKPRIAKLIDTVFFWRDLSAPRGERCAWRWKSWARSSSSSARCCRPGAT